MKTNRKPTRSVQYHQWIENPPRINVKVEKNSRGYNYEATVTGARSVEEAVSLVAETERKLREQFGEPPA